jgi:tRNA threonylcarbamoyladenosine biosynthesis protein TsaB
MKSIILNIETSTEVCSVCLSSQKLILSERSVFDTMSHSSILSKLIKDVLREAALSFADLDGVSVSKGPGSYTGLRVGASVAKGICYAADCPLIEINTLQALACSAYRQLKTEGLYIPMIDARRKEVYLSVFKNDEELHGPKALVIHLDYFKSLTEENLPLIITGNGADKAWEMLHSELNLIHYPAKCNAAILAPLAFEALERNDFTNIAQFSPFYLKPPNITYAKNKI